MTFEEFLKVCKSQLQQGAQPTKEKKPSKKKKSKKEEAPVEILSLDELNK